MIGALTIAIDGPGSSGKGTVARAVARALGYRHVDTGAVYRAVALLGLRSGLPLDDGEALARLAARTLFAFGPQGQITVDGEDVSAAIRRDEVGQAASTVSAHPAVRQALLALQRQAAEGGGVVLDGRDIGTVVLPGADLKVFLDATLEERARRRTADLAARGAPVAYEEVLAALAARDDRDRNRPVAPLRPAADAVVVDSTHLTVEEATEVVLSLVRSRVPAL